MSPFFDEVRFPGPSSVFKKSRPDVDQWEKNQVASNKKSDSANNAYARLLYVYGEMGMSHRITLKFRPH